MWRAEPDPDSAVGDLVGNEIARLHELHARAKRPVASSGCPSGQPEELKSFEDAYIEGFNRRRAGKGGYKMQKSLLVSPLHPLTKSLAAGKHGGFKEWIRGKVIAPSTALNSTYLPAGKGVRGILSTRCCAWRWSMERWDAYCTGEVPHHHLGAGLVGTTWGWTGEGWGPGLFLRPRGEKYSATVGKKPSTREKTTSHSDLPGVVCRRLP